MSAPCAWATVATMARPRAVAFCVADTFGADPLEGPEQPLDVVGDDRAGVGDGKPGLPGCRDRGHLDGPVGDVVV